MTQLELQVVAPADADAQELDELTSKLRGRLLDLDVDSVERPTRGPPPAGSRALDVVAVGALLVTLGQATTGLSTVVRAVQGWLSGHEERRVELTVGSDTLVLTGASSEQQERLIGAWLERHAGAA